jgi:hypothetical protein
MPIFSAFNISISVEIPVDLNFDICVPLPRVVLYTM